MGGEALWILESRGFNCPQKTAGPIGHSGLQTLCISILWREAAAYFYFIAIRPGLLSCLRIRAEKSCLCGPDEAAAATHVCDWPAQATRQNAIKPSAALLTVCIKALLYPLRRKLLDPLAAPCVSDWHPHGQRSNCPL